MSETAVYKPEDLRPILMASLTACWLAAAGLIWLSSPWSAVFFIILGTIAVIAQLSLGTVVLAFIFLLPFDLHRQIGGQWVYVDLLTATVAIPLVRLKRWPPVLCWLLFPFFVYFILTGAPRSLLPVWFWGYAARWFIALCFCAAVAMSGEGEKLAIAAGITLIPLTTYGLYQLFLGDFGWLYNWMNPHMLDQPWMARSYSLLWHPNAFGDFAGMVSAILFALAAKGYKPTLSLSLASVGIVGVVCSGSRGAEIGTTLAVLIALSQSRKLWWKLAVILSVALVIWGAQNYFQILPIERAEVLDEFTTETRLMFWGAAYIGWQRSPWIGLGATNFREVMPNFINSEAVHAHNTYLQFLAETGLIGFVLFYGPLVYFLWRAWRARSVPIAFAGVCALVFWFVHGFTDYLLMDHPQCLLLLFTVIGLIVGGLSPRNKPGVVESL
jgi:O-antigen ligase